MSTEAQVTANRENGKKGGVKTDKGKEISKYNALKHGVFRVEISDYEKDCAEKIQQFVYEEYQPENFEQNLVVNRIIHCLIRLARINKAEDEYMLTVTEPDVGIDMEWGITRGYKPKMNSEHVKTLSDTYLRYRITIENRLDKSIKQIKKLKAKNATKCNNYDS